MTLPFHIDTAGTIGAAVILAFLIWCYTRPRNHFIKELWRIMGRGQAEAWQRLFGQRVQVDMKRAAFVDHLIFWVASAALTVCIMAGVEVWLGVLTNPPRTGYREIDTRHINPDDYEIITEGNVIYARRKDAKPTDDTPDDTEP